MWYDEDTFPAYLASLVIQVISGGIYASVVYSQVGFIVNYYFYAKCFIDDDIQFQLDSHENASQHEMEKCTIDLIEFHIAIIG